MKKSFLVFSAVAVLTLAACGGSSSNESNNDSDTTVASSISSEPSESTVQEITITIGKNSGTDVVSEVKQGEEVKVTFLNNDADDEIHIHGYDLSTGDMKKGTPSSITFTASKTGDFEMESHVSEEVVQILRVVPS